MHLTIVAIGVLLVVMIAVHIFFRIIKFTLAIFFLGLALIAFLYVFQQYFGIDLLAQIGTLL